MVLPAPSENQAYCEVSALEAGLLELPDAMFIHNASHFSSPGKVTTAPSLSFLLRHSADGQNFVFDLGISKDHNKYPPAIVNWIRARGADAVRVDQDAAESLAKGGISPDDIKYICLSHCHWDHTGDINAFKNSTFLVGGACKALIEPGSPGNAAGDFPADLLPEGRTIFYDPSGWPPIGPFPRALDFYGDGSLYIIDAPGHLAGHINVLARTSPDGGWIYLAGDSAHHWNLLTLESAIAVGTPGHPHFCAHGDKDAAEAHILRINALMKIPRVRVILAHDEPFYSNNKGGSAFWPGKIPSP